jgi:hypothetical protein
MQKRSNEVPKNYETNSTRTLPENAAYPFAALYMVVV